MSVPAGLIVREQLVVSRDRTYGGINSGEFCTVHETTNPNRGANAAAHANLQSGGNVRSASWHEQVDDTEAVVSFPDEVQCWHAGDGAGPGNLSSYAIEVCVNADGDHDQALANAAARVRAWRERTGHGRDRVVQHNRWSAKDCPSILRSRGPAAWATFVASTDPGTTTPKETPVSDPYFAAPVAGRISSDYGTRRHPITGAQGFHRGIDIAAAQGTAVRAAYGGTVRQALTGRAHRDGRPNPVTGTWNTGNAVIIDGPGGGSEFYGHLHTVAVKVGQVVKAGDVIGTVGQTGNVTGPHLHFETWNGRSQGVGTGAGSTRDPKIDYRKYGITPGAAGSGGTAPAPAPTPTPTPTPTPPSTGGGSTTRRQGPGRSRTAAEVKRVQAIVRGLGYYTGPVDGDYGPNTVAGVRAYQTAQRYPTGSKRLARDGDWGPATQAHYDWVRRLQTTLNAWRGDNIRVDGDYGAATAARVRDVQQRNHGGAYTGTVDGIPGPVTSRMLGTPTHPAL